MAISMARGCAAAIGLLLISLAPASAQHFVEAFDDYPAKVDKSRAVPPSYKGDDAWAQNFRTRIKRGLAAGVTFGGRYSMIEFGCGTSCLIALAVDRKTGDIIDFPRGGEDNYSMQVRYQPTSRLVHSTWVDMDKNQCVLEFFEVTKGTFSRVSELRTARPKDDYCEVE